MIRSEFLVALLHDSADLGKQFQRTISRYGYPCRWYPSVSTLLNRVPDEPPHMVLLDVETCQASFADICNRLHALSPEIKILILCPPEKLAAIASIREALGLADVILTPLARDYELTHALDRITTELYFMFENEQLFQEVQDLKKKSEELLQAQAEMAKRAAAVPVSTPEPEPESLQAEPPPVAAAPVTMPNELASFVRQFHDLDQNMAAAKDPQDLTDIFMKQISQALNGRPVIFFKYLPAYASLLAAQTCGLPLEKIRGIGVNLTKEDPLLAEELLKVPERMPQLRALLREAFNRPQFHALTLEIMGEIMGVFVVFTEGDILQTALATVWDAFRLHYQNKLLLKRNHDLEVQDPLTGLANRRHFEKEMEDELARSRRTYLPTALIVLDIDDFEHYNTVNGQVNGNFVLKQIAKILRKTSRTHDILARLDNDQFCLLLPHTDARGAAVKAERLRRIIEATKFHLGERQPKGRLTMSLGVSEYPSLAGDAQGLLDSADEAMYLVEKRGGNKVCVASVQQTFKPDFQVGSLPSRQGLQLESQTEFPQHIP